MSKITYGELEFTYKDNVNMLGEKEIINTYTNVTVTKGNKKYPSGCKIPNIVIKTQIEYLNSDNTSYTSDEYIQVKTEYETLLKKEKFGLIFEVSNLPLNMMKMYILILNSRDKNYLTSDESLD